MRGGQACNERAARHETDGQAGQRRGQRPDRSRPPGQRHRPDQPRRTPTPHQLALRRPTLVQDGMVLRSLPNPL